jgi:hypothetical protein
VVLIMVYCSNSRRFLIITKLRNPPVVESGYGFRKANASFVTVDVCWDLTCSIQACLLPSFSLSQNVHTKIRERAEERKKERRGRSEYFNTSYSTSRKAKNRSIDRRISGPGPGTGTVCEIRAQLITINNN